jgi:hypothetical protein
MGAMLWCGYSVIEGRRVESVRRWSAHGAIVGKGHTLQQYGRPFNANEGRESGKSEPNDPPTVHAPNRVLIEPSERKVISSSVGLGSTNSLRCSLSRWSAMGKSRSHQSPQLHRNRALTHR